MPHLFLKELHRSRSLKGEDGDSSILIPWGRGGGGSSEISVSIAGGGGGVGNLSPGGGGEKGQAFSEQQGDSTLHKPGEGK